MMAKKKSDWADDTQPSTELGPNQPASYAELLASMSTPDLVKLRADLRSHIPGDPTFASAVSRILGHLLDVNITHPDRRVRDEQEAAAKAEAEKAALVEDDPGDDIDRPAPQGFGNTGVVPPAA